MAEAPHAPLTELLSLLADGDDSAHERIWAMVYDELRAMARAKIANEAPARTFQATALVHEAYFRLFGSNGASYADRRHFFAAAAESMRRILVDDARRRSRRKRGGGKRPASLNTELAVSDPDAAEVLNVHEVLDRLEAADPRKAAVVKLRYFAGLRVCECAEVLGVSDRTVESDWRYARAWLHRALSMGDTAGQ